MGRIVSATDHVVVLSVGEYDRLLRAQRRQEDWRTLVSRRGPQLPAELDDMAALEP